MKPIVFRTAMFVLLSVLTSSVFAQWLRNSTDGYTYLQSSGDNVGIGTSTPAVKLDVGGWTGKPSNIAGVNTSFEGDLVYGNDGTGVPRTRIASNGSQSFLQWNMFYTTSNSFDRYTADQPAYELTFNGTSPTFPTWPERDRIIFRRWPSGTGSGGGIPAPTTLMTIDKDGNVTVPGTVTAGGNMNVTGTITADKVIGAVYQDIAEWVPATADMTAGTVVVLNPGGVNEVMPSHKPYDTMVAGVVTEQPGIVLGRAGDAKEQIATYGRVKVRADATKLPIRVGDLLVTGDQPGTAMRSEPIELQGRSFHQPGTIIGKALEPLDGGRGEILVLLSMQ